MRQRTITRSARDPRAGSRRLLRATAFGMPCYALALLAHVTAGGAWPGWPVTLMLTLLLGVTGLALTHRRRRFGSLLTPLLAAQAGLHWVLSMTDLTTPTGRLAPGCVDVLVSAHQHGGCSASTAAGAVTDLATATIGGTGSTPAAMVMPSPLMVVAHLLATVATAWLLARGEAWLWRAVDWLVPALVRSHRPRRVLRRVLSAQVPTTPLGTPPGMPGSPRGPPVPA